MGLYADYLKERDGLETLSTEQGFAVYKFRGNECYIQDIYVVPKYRSLKVASSLANEIAKIAKKAGYHILTGSIDSRANGAKTSIKGLEAYGMKPYTTIGFMTYYAKELT